jgi:segregation and condensation protein A
MIVEDSYQTHAYKVSTPVYEGPLDLLLHLIERAELDITKLALAQVTDQYLEHLRGLPERLPEEVSAFLAIASKLIQIKSEMLLPRPPIREQDEDDPGESLARQLRLYKQFREIACRLAGLEAEGLRTYPRLAPSPKIDTSIDLSGITVEDLLFAAISAFSRVDTGPELESVVSTPRVSIREKIGLITGYLKKHQRGTFHQLLPRRPFRLDVVVTFLALLELVKRHFVQAHQDSTFGEIEFEANQLWSEEESFDLEFGE